MRGRSKFSLFGCKKFPTAQTTGAMTEAATEAGRQAALYEEAVAAHAAALARLARGYEADRELCRDLQQEIHIRLWQSLARFDGRCSLRTWVYRWYLGPLALGMVMFAVGGAVKNPGTSGVVVAAALIAGTFALFGYIGKLNMRATAELQRQIDALSALERPPTGEP